MPEHRRRLGIIGCGAVAQQMYAKTLPRSPFVRTEVVTDLRAESARTLAASLGARVGTAREVYDGTDAIVIATPPSSHFDLVSASLREAPIVVCEKPFVGRRAEADALVRMAAELGRTLYVAHFRRVFPSVRLARAIGKTGVLGSVTGLSIVEGGRFSWEAESGYVSTDPFGGVLYDTGSHTIDMALYAAGLDEAPLSVHVLEVRRDRQEPSHELNARFELMHADGSPILVALRLSRYEALANVVRITYERGELLLSAGLRGTVRLIGEGGSTVLHPNVARTDFSDCFVDQWNAMFGPDVASEFEARRFINLTGVLEALASAT